MSFVLLPSSFKAVVAGVPIKEAPLRQRHNKNPCALWDGLGAEQAAQCVDHVPSP